MLQFHVICHPIFILLLSPDARGLFQIGAQTYGASRNVGLCCVVPGRGLGPWS
jgi:hypothetical protein